jgi:hypothetical protein
MVLQMFHNIQAIVKFCVTICASKNLDLNIFTKRVELLKFFVAVEGGEFESAGEF